MTADDVVFTFARHLDPKIVTNQKPLYSNVDIGQALDRNTVRFTLKRPDPLFNGSVVTTLAASILSRKAFEEKGADFTMEPDRHRRLPGREREPDRGRPSDAPFPSTSPGRRPRRQSTSRFIADTTARTLAFASGQVDMIEGVRTPGWIPTMRQRSAADDLRRDGARQLQPAAPQPDPAAAERSARAAGDPLRHQHRADRGGLRRPRGADGRDHRAAVRRLREDGVAAAGAAVQLRSAEGQGAAGRGRPPERRDHSLLHQPAGGLRRDHADASRSSCARPASISTSRSSTTRPCTRRTARTATRVALYSSSYPPVPTQPFLQLLSTAAEVKADGIGRGELQPLRCRACRASTR